MEIKELNKQDIELANQNSMFNRGTNTNNGYIQCAEEIMSYNISEDKKQKLLDKLYKYYSEMISLDAQYVPVTVAGPARYNSQKHGSIADKRMQLSVEVCSFMDDIREQIKQSSLKEDKQEEIQRCKEWMQRCFNEGNTWYIATELMKLALYSSEEFIKEFEFYNDKLKFRKNSNVYKVYVDIKENGRSFEKKPAEVLFENVDYKVYSKNERIFIKFTMRPARQLIVALKSRGYWWNTNENAWSTYPKRYNKEWAEHISDDYKKYI